MWTSILGQFCVTAIPDERILLSVTRAPTSSIGFGPYGRPLLPDAHERQTKEWTGQRAAKGQVEQAQEEARSSQPARLRGMGPKIRRELGRGDIAEGLLFFLGRGLWWWTVGFTRLPHV